MRTSTGRKIGIALLSVLMLASALFAFLLPAARAGAEGGRYTYDFTDPDTVSKLETYYQLGEALSDRGAKEEFGAHWQVGSEGEVTRINDLGTTSASGQYAELYFDRLFKNFEMNFSIKMPSGEPWGWSGVMFGKNDRTASMYHDGDSAFFGTQWQNIYLHGLTVGGNSDAGNYVPFGEGYKADDWNSVTLRVYGGAEERTVEIALNGTKMLTNVKETAPVSGYVCLFTTSATASFKDVSFKYLDESGAEAAYVPVTGVSFAETELEAEVGGSVTLSPAVAPENATFKDVVYSTEDTGVVRVAEDGTVRFLSAGEATITAASKDVPGISDSITFTVKDPLSYGETVAYDFAEPATLSDLMAYYQLGELPSDRGAKEEFGAHWQVGSEGEVTRINGLGGSASGQYAELYFDRLFKNFEMNFSIKMPSGEPWGWSGVMFGKNDLTASMWYDGDAAFFGTQWQSIYLHGQTVGGNGDVGNNTPFGEGYKADDWNSVTLRVYGGAEERTVELSLNGTKMLTNVKETAPVSGYVCLFTTSGEASFKDVFFRQLNAEGGYIDKVVPAQSVTLKEVETSVRMGDEVTLEATVLPADSTMTELEFTSSAPEIAAVTADGKVTFLAAGEVTITVKVKDAPEVTDEVTFTVAKAEARPEIGNKISEATVGDEHTLQVSAMPPDPAAKYGYKAEPADAAEIEADGTVHFLKEGKVTITVTLEGSSLTDTMSVNVKAKALDPDAVYYDFSDPDTVAALKPYYTAGSGTQIGAEEGFAAHWTVDKYGVLTRVNDMSSDMAASYAMLHFDRQFTNFEISYKMRADNAAMGWAGVMFGKAAYSTTMYVDGDAAFINVGNGGAFFHGQTIGTNDAEGNFVIMDADRYSPNEWNDVRLRVYGTAEGSPSRTVELWVNGQKVLSKSQSGAPARGYVCLFTSAVSADFKDVSFKYLDEKGEVTQHIPAQSVTLGETGQNVYIGDKVTLTANVLPADSTQKELIYNSSDLSVAIVSPDGIVTFINSGTVTITVSVADAQGVSDEIVFTVAEKLSKVEIANKVSEAKAGDTLTLQVNLVPGDYEGTLRFTSSDESIATVSETGVVTFLKEGSVTIKVRTEEFAGIVDTMTVNVKAAADEGGDTAPGEDGLPVWAIVLIAAGCAAVAAGAAIAVIKVIKGRKK